MMRRLVKFLSGLPFRILVAASETRSELLSIVIIAGHMCLFLAVCALVGGLCGYWGFGYSGGVVMIFVLCFYVWMTEG